MTLSLDGTIDVVLTLTKLKRKRSKREKTGPFSSELLLPNCDPLATAHNKEIFTLQKVSKG